MRETLPPPFSDVFIDESSQTGHRYLVLGGIIIPSNLTEEFVRRLSERRLPELPQGEMKWGKVSRLKLPAYKRVIDFFFTDEFREVVHFHSLVVDMTKHNNHKFNAGNREIGFNKEVFQLACKFSRLYPVRLNIYPDERKTDQKLDELKLMLNRHVNKKVPGRDWPFRRVQFRDSKKTLVLQLVDTLTGAIAFRLNGHSDRSDASPSKKDLCNHILARAGVRNVFQDTNVRGRFTIWHRQLR